MGDHSQQTSAGLAIHIPRSGHLVDWSNQGQLLRSDDAIRTEDANGTQDGKPRTCGRRFGRNPAMSGSKERDWSFRPRQAIDLILCIPPSTFVEAAQHEKR